MVTRTVDTRTGRHKDRWTQGQVVSGEVSHGQVDIKTGDYKNR
jgi:hypothetical protein